MTAGQISRTCTFGAFLGLVLALLVRWVWILRGAGTPWILMIICVVVGIVLWLGYKIAQERIVAKDYNKRVAARRRRMH
jgi:hypothetical protein